MAYEYYLQAHHEKDSQAIPVESILSVFRDYIKEKDDSSIDLQFDEENGCTIYFDTTATTTDSLMVSRPCGSRLLGECLYRVMLLGNFVFFEPDGKRPITLSADTEAHLPADMVNSLGKPAVARDREAFLTLFFNNR